jgi:glyoxylase-like metal-dependent hydrolase (beta-lactamase superfamily II)
MIIKQLEVGYMDNFCYIVGCEDTHQAMVIDPGSNVERILSEADKADLKIVNIVNTHGHGDHTAGNAALRDLTGAE